MLLADKRAIITGASSGIGAATAVRFGAEGASVCVNYHSDGERAAAERVVHEIRRTGHARAIAVQADVGSESDVQRMVAETVAAYGGVDVLVNNAGIEKQAPLLETSLADWDSVLRTNLTGAFLCIREVGKVMASADGGVVINTSSVHEFIPWPQFAPYCASKAGLKLLMQTAARELAPSRVRLVNVAPGAIATPINKSMLDDPDARKAVEEEVPLGRIGTPEEIAAAVVWAASSEASYVTGTTIVVDGGMSLYPKFV